MGAYSYRALNGVGKTVKGIVEGDSERQVRTHLRGQQLKPLAVEAVASRTATAKPGWKGFQKSINHRDLSLVTRQLASLVASGLPLDEALQSAARQTRKAHIKETLLQVRSKVMEGLSLAQALGESPRSFDHMYRALVRAGESAGYLGPILEQLADYTETSQHTSQRLRMAMVYPFVLLGVSVAVIGLLMAFVVPKLVGIFENSHKALPALTEMLIATSHFTVDYGHWCLLGFGLLVVAWRAWQRDPEHRRSWHKLLLKFPVIGDVIVESDCARFASTLSLLITSGVPLVEALKIAGQVLNNMELRGASETVAVAVQEGTSLHRALDQAVIFPPLMVQMAANGEANGTLGEQLKYSARNQERELELMLGTAMGLLEPLTVVFMGGAVVTIVMAILLPIFDLNTLI